MIKCIAIDDEPKALEIIERYCKKTEFLSLTSTFREPLKAISYISNEKIDLIFLDINMPDVNGLQLISSLTNKPMVIFTTAYSDYAVESYNLKAIDYLLKPISFERFLISVNKAVEIFNLKNKTKSEFVLIKSGSQTHNVKIDDIIYLEKDGNYLNVITKEKKILIRENMTDVFDIIPREGFLRVHKSFVVSLKHISTIEAHQITIGTVKIPVGNLYRDDLRKAIGLQH